MLFLKLILQSFYNFICTLDVYFAGPFAMSLNLEKIDEFSKYTFLYTWTSDPTDSNNEKLTAVFDTPGSRINRRSSLGTDT